MRPGFWQIVIIVALVALFFHRPIIAVFRALTGSAESGGKGRVKGAHARGAGSIRCYNCGASLPNGSRFCNKCGRSQDVIDV